MIIMILNIILMMVMIIIIIRIVKIISSKLYHCFLLSRYKKDTFVSVNYQMHVIIIHVITIITKMTFIIFGFIIVLLIIIILLLVIMNTEQTILTGIRHFCPSTYGSSL